MAGGWWGGGGGGGVGNHLVLLSRQHMSHRLLPLPWPASEKRLHLSQ